MGKKTVELHHVTKQYKERTLIADFNYIVLKNQRLGIIGPNGCGKSTLLKMMAGKIQPDVRRAWRLVRRFSMGYFAQEVPDMDTEQRVIDYIKDVAEYLPTQDGKIYGISDAGAISVYTGNAVCTGIQAFRRREKNDCTC